MTTDQTTICQTAGSVGLERTRFFARQLVTPDDLTQDQIYVRDRLRRHNRLIHGWGVVCGARVRKGDGDCEVVVESGYVLGPYGDEIVLDREVVVDVCAEDVDGNAVSPCGEYVDPWCANIRVDRRPGQPLYLAVRWAECQTRPVRVQPVGCGCDETDCEYSRVRDSFAIKVLTKLPASYPEPMPRPNPDDLLRCTQNGDCRGRVCPDCPSEPWVILADITLTADGKIGDIDCFSHRRYVVSFADFYILCEEGKVTKRPGLGAIDLRPWTAQLVAARALGRLVDLSAASTAAAPAAMVPVKRADGSWVSLPAYFTVQPGDTVGSLLAREGDRVFADPVTNETFTLRELYALAGTKPDTPVTSPAAALAPLEGESLAVTDLRVVRGGLSDILDARGLKRLDEVHAGTPGAVHELAATDLRGVSPDSTLGRKLAKMSVADVAGTTQEEFVARATARVPAAQRTAVERQAAEVWTQAKRAVKLAEAWRR